MTNRKLHTRFRLVPKSMTSDDLERPLRTPLHKTCVSVVSEWSRASNGKEFPGCWSGDMELRVPRRAVTVSMEYRDQCMRYRTQTMNFR